MFIDQLFFSSVFLQFSRLEEKRQKAERLHQQQKHDNQMREMIGQCDGNVRELQQLQVRGGGVSCWVEVGVFFFTGVMI